MAVPFSGSSSSFSGPNLRGAICGFLFFRVEECQNASAAARSCSSLFCSTDALCLGESNSHLLEIAASRRFLAGGFCFGGLRDAGV
jgi:hypothetical protein